MGTLKPKDTAFGDYAACGADLCVLEISVDEVIVNYLSAEDEENDHDGEDVNEK